MGMPRPLSPAAVAQNRAFLAALGRGGNIRLACRETGLNYATMQRRRARHPAFAQAWDAALALAQARLGAAGPRRPAAAARAASPLRTQGGEAVVVRRANGTLQVRSALPGKLTREAEQAFLAALSATANVRLAAAAVGVAHSSIYWRRRNHPAFAREMRLALRRGYERLELALLEAGLAGSHEHDEWRRNDPPALPPMTVNQALQLMYLHQKEARLLAEPDHIRRRRGESSEAHSLRLAAMYEARLQRDREAFDIAEAERWAAGEPPWGPAGEAVRAELGEAGLRALLPDLAQVGGWSRADPDAAPHDGSRALFGGWRIDAMEGRRGAGDRRPGEGDEGPPRE